MPHLQAIEEAGQGRGEDRRGVALDQHDVGLVVLDHPVHTIQGGAHDIEHGLTFLHDAEVVGGIEPKDLEGLIDERRVLARECDARLHVGRMVPESRHDGGHFDRLGSGADDDQDAMSQARYAPAFRIASSSSRT